MSSKGKVLVLDDSQPILDVVRERLERSGYDVVTALTVQKACENIHDRQVAIVDYHMPGVTGTEAMRMLRLATATARNTCRFYLYTTDPSKSAEYVAEGFDGVYTMKGNVDALERQLEATMRVVRLTQATRGGAARG
jgi:CheY-like chemotaxis protein